MESVTEVYLKCSAAEVKQGGKSKIGDPQKIQYLGFTFYYQFQKRNIR